MYIDVQYKYTLRKRSHVYILFASPPQIYPTTGYVTKFLSTIIDIQYRYTMGLYIAFVRARNWLT